MTNLTFKDIVAMLLLTFCLAVGVYATYRVFASARHVDEMTEASKEEQRPVTDTPRARIIGSGPRWNGGATTSFDGFGVFAFETKDGTLYVVTDRSGNPVAAQLGKEPK